MRAVCAYQEQRIFPDITLILRAAGDDRRNIKREHVFIRAELKLVQPGPQLVGNHHVERELCGQARLLLDEKDACMRNGIKIATKPVPDLLWKVAARERLGSPGARIFKQEPYIYPGSSPVDPFLCVHR